MTIAVRCSCGIVLQAKDQWVGRRAKCPQCGSAVLIQRSSSATVPAHSATDRVFDEAFPTATGVGESPFAPTPTPTPAPASAPSKSRRSWFGWLFWKFPSFGSTLRWREPLAYRSRLRGDLLLRLLVAIAMWVGGTGLFLLIFAFNSNFHRDFSGPSGIASGFGLGVFLGSFIGCIGIAAMFMARGQTSGHIRLNEKALYLDRFFMGLTGSWTEWAEWPCSSIRRCVIVPPEALGKWFSVMVLSLGWGQEIVGIPNSVDLEKVKKRLSKAGLSVEFGRSVPAEHRQPISFTAPLVTGVIGACLFLVGLGSYLINANDQPAQAEQAPEVQRPSWLDARQQQQLDRALAASRGTRRVDEIAQQLHRQGSRLNAPDTVLDSQSTVDGNAGQQRDTSAAADNDLTPSPSGTSDARGPGGRFRPDFGGPPIGRFGGGLGPRDRFGPGGRSPLRGRTGGSQFEITRRVGGTGGRAFSDASPNGAPVVGFQYTIGSWEGKNALQTLVPLHNRPASGSGLQTVVAREGYAVGAIHVAADELVEAVQVEFMRVTPEGKLDTADTYLSEWIGTPGELTPEKLGGTGAPVVGVHGRKAAVLDSIGLVMRQ